MVGKKSGRSACCRHWHSTCLGLIRCAAALPRRWQWRYQRPHDRSRTPEMRPPHGRRPLNGIHRVTAQSICQISNDHLRPEVEFFPNEHVPSKSGIGLHPRTPGPTDPAAERSKGGPRLSAGEAFVPYRIPGPFCFLLSQRSNLAVAPEELTDELRPHRRAAAVARKRRALAGRSLWL